MCDTFVALNSATADRSVIFGKNSDREPNEAMALEFVAGSSHQPARRLRCTYVEIPQVRQTHDVLLCRPFWMWGAEMGANQKGLVIGNEAAFTRMPVNRGDALTGTVACSRSSRRCRQRRLNWTWPAPCAACGIMTRPAICRPPICLWTASACMPPTRCHEVFKPPDRWRPT